MKKYVTILLVVAFVFTAFVVFAGKDEEEKAVEEVAGEPIMMVNVGDPVEIPDTTGMTVGKIGFIPYHFENWFWSGTGRETRRIIEEHGGMQIDFDPKGDPTRELQGIESFIAQGVDGILMCAIDPRAFTSALNEATSRGIKVIALLDYPLGVDLTAVVYPNHVRDGYLAGKATVEGLNGKGKIVIYDLPQSKGCLERQEGYDAALAEAPGIEILARERWGGTGEPTSPSAQYQMEAWLNKYPDIDGVIAVADNAAIGALAAIEAAGRTGIKIFTIDGSPEAVDAMKAGRGIYSTACLFYEPVAEMGAKMMIAALNGVPPVSKWVECAGGNLTIADVKDGKGPMDILPKGEPFFTAMEPLD